MTVPAEIPDVGSTAQRLVQSPTFDPTKAGFGTEDYFVWSRFDGTTTVKDLILMTGLPVDRVVDIVRKLRRLGAIVAPTSPIEPPSRPRAPTSGSIPAVARTATSSNPPPIGRAPTVPAI